MPNARGETLLTSSDDLMYRRTPTRYQELSSNDELRNNSYSLEENGLRPTQNPSEHRTLSASRLTWLLSFSNPVSYVWRETITDLKQIGWQRIVDVAYNHVVPVFVMMSLLGITILLAVRPPLTEYQNLCRPDGSTSIYTSDWKPYDPWRGSEVFTINIGFGKLKFGQAKLIDVIWDTTFGHGGQALLALISYRVLTSTMTLSMEQESVTLGTFEAITLNANAVSSIAKLLQDFSKNKSARFRKLAPFIILSSILVLIFPTLASAMTGYSANFDAQISITNDSTIPFTSLQKVWYIIHDGSRLGQGFHDDYPVTDSTGIRELDLYPYYGSYPSVQELEESLRQWLPGCSRYAPGKIDSNNVISLQTSSMSNESECQLLWDTSRYTSTHGFLGYSNSSSSFYNVFSQTNISLSPPALNVTSVIPRYLYSPFSLQPPSLAWSVLPFGVPSSQSSQPGVDYGLRLAYHDEEDSLVLISGTDPLTAVKCHQQSPGSDIAISYQWGFAFLPLLLCAILLLVWTTLVYAMHVHVRRSSQLVQQNRTIGPKRAVLDLAPIYKQHFDKDVSMYNEKQIQKLVEKSHISFEELVRLHPVITRSQRASGWPKASDVHVWIKSELICLVLMMLTIVMIPLGICTHTYPAMHPYLLPLLFAGFVFMLAAGKKHFSRWLLFLPGLVVFLGLQVWYISSYL